MAKGKHATALFEVIHASKQFGNKEQTAGLLRTPKWWFKGRKKAGKEADPTERATASGSPTPAAASPTAAAPDTGATQTAQESAASPAPAPLTIASATKTSRTPAVDVLVDGAQHRITLRVSYTSALVSSFAIVVVVGMAYMVGRHMSRGPAPAMGGPATEQLREGPARPDVLDVGGSRNPAGQRTSPGTDQAAPRTPGQTQTAPPPRLEPTPPPQPPGRRVNGLNYVIVQGYPDEASAKAAVDILKQHGVGATIEKGLRGMKSDWFIVVGTDGFSRVSSTEFEEYVRKIKLISDKFAGKRSFKAFEPMGYRWDRP